MRTLLIAMLIALPCLLSAQKHGILKGIAYDSTNDYALQLASVSVYKQADSSIVDYQLTNTLGEFEMKNIPVKTKLYYIISYTGYISAHNNFELDSVNIIKDLKRVFLREKAAGELDEVVVKSVLPIRMNSDTLEINPNAFKIDSNAVVEDMLLRVPGLTVWGDGTITMNGKRVEKFLVNGKPFFGGAAQTATQNLPKNAIEKIQLYQQKDFTKISNTDEKQDSLYTMNIKLKEEKNKGLFGKVSAGYGTDDRYTADGVIQGYTKKTQGGFAAGINNINKEEGTGENAFQENTFKSNFRIYYGGRGGGGGITQRTYANLKVQHSFSEADNGQYFNRMTGDYGFLNTRTNNTSHTTNVQNIVDYKRSYISNSESNNDNTNNNVKFQYENRRKFGSFLTLNAIYNNYNNNSNSSGNTAAYFNDSILTSSSNYISNSRNRGDNMNLFGYVTSNDYEMREDPRKNYSMYFSGSFGNNESNMHTVNEFMSYVDTIPSSKIERAYHNRNNNFRGNVGMDYNGFRPLIFGIYNFFNINISLKNEISFSRDESDSKVSDLDSVTGAYVLNPALTNFNRRTNFIYNPGLGFSKSFNKNVWGKYYFWLNVGFDLRYQFMNQKNESSFLNRNLDRTFNLLAPRFNFSFNYNKEQAFRIQSYLWGNRTAELPSIDQLFPIVDSTERYNITVGNPLLKPMYNTYITYNFDISRNNPAKKSTYGASISFNPEFRRYAIGDSSIYDSSGRSFRYLINVDHQNNYRGGLNLNYSTKLNTKNTLGFTYATSFNTNKRPGYVNNVEALSRNNSFSNNFSVLYSLVDKFNINLGQGFSVNNSEQMGRRSITSRIKNYSTNANVNYFITKEITFNTSVNYQNNIAANGNSVEATIWNASALYRFMKQKAEVKLSAFDILRQNKYIRNFVNDNYATTTITNGLQQYFMVTLSYYPRKFGGTPKGGSNSRMGGIMIIK